MHLSLQYGARDLRYCKHVYSTRLYTRLHAIIKIRKENNISQPH